MREINVTYLDKYEVFLRSRGCTNGGIAVRMRGIRTIFNLAIRRDLIKQALYRFHKYKITKLRAKKIKRALTNSEMQSCKNIDCQGDVQFINAKNYSVQLLHQGYELCRYDSFKMVRCCQQAYHLCQGQNPGQFLLKDYTTGKRNLELLQRKQEGYKLCLSHFTSRYANIYADRAP